MSLPLNTSLKPSCVYIAPEDRVAELKSELRNIVFEKDCFFIAEGPLQRSFWAQNVWLKPHKVSFESIKDASKILKAEQRRWWHYPLSHVRRTKHIQEALPKVRSEVIDFPAEVVKNTLGSFALLSEKEMIFSTQCLSPLPNGEYNFQVPPYETPGKAYLKLWEALTRQGICPKAGEFCVDLGSSPGSWTQALLKLGAQVLSIDKADLEIAPSKHLSFLKKDAFKLDPLEVGSTPKWVFSDIICYPEKLLSLAKAWKAAHPQANFVFTIKFQGKWEREIVEKFAELPNSQVMHLFNNKHELCWISTAQV